MFFQRNHISKDHLILPALQKLICLICKQKYKLYWQHTTSHGSTEWTLRILHCYGMHSSYINISVYVQNSSVKTEQLLLINKGLIYITTKSQISKLWYSYSSVAPQKSRKLLCRKGICCHIELFGFFKKWCTYILIALFIYVQMSNNCMLSLFSSTSNMAQLLQK